MRKARKICKRTRFFKHVYIHKLLRHRVRGSYWKKDFSFNTDRYVSDLMYLQKFLNPELKYPNSNTEALIKRFKSSRNRYDFMTNDTLRRKLKAGVKKNKRLPNRLRYFKRYSKISGSPSYGYSRARIKTFLARIRGLKQLLKKRYAFSKLAPRLGLNIFMHGYMMRVRSFGIKDADLWLRSFLGKPYYHPSFNKAFHKVLTLGRFANIRRYKRMLLWNKIRFKEKGRITEAYQSKYFIKLRQTTNNCFVTLTTRTGKVLYSCSAGLLGFQGPRRMTQPAGEAIGKSIINFILRRRLKSLLVVLQSPVTFQIRSIVAGFGNSKRFFVGVINAIPQGHNGLRGRKVRRV